jgi:polysaccharide export outer membrane protein
MAIRFLIALFVVQLLLVNPAHSQVKDFIIGAGDTISIKVYNEPDLNVAVKVAKTGLVKMPLIGNIQVIGKTTEQLSKEIEQAYFDGYLVDPSVAVNIEAYRPFYIRGAVVYSGSYDFEFDLTVDQAIAIAGGLKDRASDNKWFVIRGEDKQRLPVTSDSLVYPGDIIEIEESLF